MKRKTAREREREENYPESRDFIESDNRNSYRFTPAARATFIPIIRLSCFAATIRLGVSSYIYKIAAFKKRKHACQHISTQQRLSLYIGCQTRRRRGYNNKTTAHFRPTRERFLLRDRRDNCEPIYFYTYSAR